ncbi:hypothetical protein O181_080274 [Austropuccinia psidii MF-1]|uniref:Uncharacterized protein n=1 Tax=Austropuccinia psidii MF-1 TaxID=1389203 RepID=A0A9Q3FKK2_9BASI|nr:hypothetical protein [Austropuccinia psidii MF-1]
MNQPSSVTPFILPVKINLHIQISNPHEASIEQHLSTPIQQPSTSSSQIPSPVTIPMGPATETFENYDHLPFHEKVPTEISISMSNKIS